MPGEPGSGRPVLFYITTQAGHDIRTVGVRLQLPHM